MLLVRDFDLQGMTMEELDPSPSVDPIGDLDLDLYLELAICALENSELDGQSLLQASFADAAAASGGGGGEGADDDYAVQSFGCDLIAQSSSSSVSTTLSDSIGLLESVDSLMLTTGMLH